MSLELLKRAADSDWRELAYGPVKMPWDFRSPKELMDWDAAVDNERRTHRTEKVYPWLTVYYPKGSSHDWLRERPGVVQLLFGAACLSPEEKRVACL